MESREEIRLDNRNLKRVMVFGLLISCISIIMSVEYLFREKKYIELIITSVVFITLLILIRWINN